MSWRLAWLGIGLALGVAGLGGLLAAAADATTGSSSPSDGAALYASRCASCHDAGGGRAPAKDVLSLNPPGFIVSALRDGVMAPMATGLSLDQMVAIARYISKTKPAAEIDPKWIWGPSAATMPLDGPPCPGKPPPIDLAAPQWNGWSPQPDNARFQPRPGLSATQVPQLKLAWAFNYPGSKNGQATVIGERLFVTSMSGAVYALNAKTGCVYWRHVADAATRSSVSVVRLPGDGRARYALFYSDWTKSAVALDADTGQQLWKTRIDDAAGVQMTGAPTVYGGRLFVPVSSGVEAFAQNDAWECCKFRGSVVALDIATGKILWKTYTTREEPHVFGTNRLGNPMWGPSGGAIWSAPTVDPARGVIYVGTSNSYTALPYDGADAVIAIDMASGAVRWKLQLLPHDDYIEGCHAWAGHPVAANCPAPVGPDFEIGASPVLAHLAGGHDRLVVGQKSGAIFALDPDRQGKIIWQTRLGPGGELGGVEFGLAFDGDLVFAGISDVVSGPTGKPGLYALRIADGSLAWAAPNPIKPTCRWTSYWCHGAISQAVTAIPGVVFAGSYDGHFRAYAAKTGKVIWDYDTGSNPISVVGGRTALGGVMDGGGPTVAGGMVYVHSGYAGRSSASGREDLRSAAGNVLLAFSANSP